MNLLPATIEILKERLAVVEENLEDACEHGDPESAEDWRRTLDAIGTVLASPTVEVLRGLPPAMDELSNWVDIAFAGRADWTRDDTRQVRSVVIDLARAEFYGKTDPNALVTGRRVSTIVVDGVQRDFGYPLRIKC